LRLAHNHPSDEDLSPGTPVNHPSDEDLSPGTPVNHPSDEDLSPGPPAARQSPLRMRACFLMRTSDSGH
jgi:hypothetical protein